MRRRKTGWIGFEGRIRGLELASVLVEYFKDKRVESEDEVES